MARPAIGCSTLCTSDFIRVPFPAARITAAKSLCLVICPPPHCHGNLAISRAGRESAAMTGFPFDVVAFDLDGTLANTAPDLAAALNHTLGRLGRPQIDPDSVR